MWDRPKDRQIPVRMIQKTKGRNLGSCVLHLTSVASGQMEFAVMEKIKLWDLAAAGLILLQAGGRLTDLEGKRIFPLSKSFAHYAHSNISFVASNGRIHRQVLDEFVSPG